MLKTKHVPALDGVRGLAIIAVIAFHSGVFPFGWAGVDLFFVLSGFLITGILMRSKGSAHYFRTFYARRTLRIFPLYYAFLFVVIVVLPLHTGQPVSRPWSYWFYVSNITNGIDSWRDPAAWGRVAPQVQHLWSLAIEEQFYLFWPMIVWLAPRRLLPLLCIAGIVGTLLIRAALVVSGHGGPALYLLTPTRIDGLLIGAWVALRLARSDRTYNRWATPLLVSMAGCVTALFAWRATDPTTDLWLASIGFTVIALCGGALVNAALQPGWVASVCGQLPLRLAGRYSYAAYLFHPLIAVWLFRHGVPRGWPTAIALISISFALAAASWRLFEAPILSLNRFVPAEAALETLPIISATQPTALHGDRNWTTPA